MLKPSVIFEGFWRLEEKPSTENRKTERWSFLKEKRNRL